MSSLLFPLHKAALCYLDQRQEIINSLTCQKSCAGKRATWSLPSSSVCGEAQRSVLRGWDGLEGTTSSSLGWIGSWEFSPGSQYKVYKASKTSQCVFAAHARVGPERNQALSDTTAPRACSGVCGYSQPRPAEEKRDKWDFRLQSIPANR